MALKDLHSETQKSEQAYLVGDSIVRPLQETWKGWDENGNTKAGKSCVGLVTKLMISQGRSENYGVRKRTSL